MDWVASILLWIGNIFVIKKRWYSFVFFLIANIIWSVYWFNQKEWAAFVLVISFIIQDIIGIYKWRKDK